MNRLARTLGVLASDLWREDGEALTAFAIMCAVAGAWCQVVGWLVRLVFPAPPGPTVILGFVCTGAVVMAVLVPWTVYAIIRDSLRAIRNAWDRTASPAPSAPEDTP